ncbi:MAG: hypothetical protein JWM99_5158 [Verrucomicrobiales bacterium]|jgi:hypothetical protein|nr:hypothetical protein [Verrucomicrobiales bacterium]
MKKFITTAGLAVLGAAGVQGAWAPGASSTETTKPWSVSATLRGFYDDNYATRNAHDPSVQKRDSFGFEISPSAALNIFRDQTSFGLSYVYDMRYYDDRKNNKADHSHQINGKVSHAFSPRFKLDANDSFVIAQEPTLIDPNGTSLAPLRSDGNNMRNTVGISFTAGLTETIDSVFTYTGTWYDYDEQGPGSRSALLDRWEHLLSFNLRRPIFERTVGVIGYQYGMVDYNSKDSVAFAGPYISPDVRDNHSHYGYLGIDQTFSPTLNASVRGGVQVTEYDDKNSIQKDTWGPYVDANATWLYTQGSYAQLGVRHQRMQTDVGVLVGGFAPNQDAEATTVYGSINHRFGPLVASLIGSYQHADLHGGLSDGKADDYLLAGINLTYEINKFLAAETGYNYDNLDSELNRIPGVYRSFSRNRVYVGIRATY